MGIYLFRLTDWNVFILTLQEVSHSDEEHDRNIGVVFPAVLNNRGLLSPTWQSLSHCFISALALFNLGESSLHLNLCLSLTMLVQCSSPPLLSLQASCAR